MAWLVRDNQNGPKIAETLFLGLLQKKTNITAVLLRIGEKKI
jgi:hypothetical protein